MPGEVQGHMHLSPIEGYCYISSTGKYGSHIGFPGARDVIVAQVLGPGDE